MVAKKVKVWQWRDVKKAVEGLFVPGERKVLLDDYNALGELVNRGKRSVAELRAIQQTEWRLVPLPDHNAPIAARLRVADTRMGRVFTVIEVRGEGGSGQPNGPWYVAVAQEINRGPKPVENPARRHRP